MREITMPAPKKNSKTIRYTREKKQIINDQEVQVLMTKKALQKQQHQEPVHQKLVVLKA